MVIAECYICIRRILHLFWLDFTFVKGVYKCKIGDGILGWQPTMPP